MRSERSTRLRTWFTDLPLAHLWDFVIIRVTVSATRNERTPCKCLAAKPYWVYRLDQTRTFHLVKAAITGA